MEVTSGLNFMAFSFIGERSLIRIAVHNSVIVPWEKEEGKIIWGWSH